jgi:23S rRNA (guanine745-N1)-methyltransferase
VRDCGLLLERRGDVWSCARGHSYDVARTGYINLLQPQDRRSRTAGDSRQAIEARARLLAAGIGSAILTSMVDRVAARASPGALIVDLGSGSGELLAGIVTRVEVLAVGIDLSTAAAEHAARRYPSMTWVVANADRGVPLLDRTADVMVSMHGRRHPAECARVLTRAGALIVAVPAPDDLIELRAAVQGRPVPRDRSAALEEEHAPYFRVVDRSELREQHSLDGESLRGLLRATYRGERASVASRIDALDRLDVTLASQVLTFQPR